MLLKDRGGLTPLGICFWELVREKGMTAVLAVAVRVRLFTRELWACGVEEGEPLSSCLGYRGSTRTHR